MIATILGEPYWCKNAPNVPRVLSPSSLSLFSECARKFQYQYIEGWTARGENLDFLFGSALHSCLEWYWKKRIIEELDFEDALNDSVGVAMALGLFLPLPSRPDQKGKTREGLTNALVWYVDHWQRLDSVDQFKILDGKPALELHFQISIPLTNPDGEPYQIQGYVDNLRDFGLPTTTDYKTTNKEPSDYYCENFDLALQTATYTLASRVLTKETYTQFLCDIIGVETRIQGFEREIPVAFMRRYLIALTQNSIDEALNDIISYIKGIERCAEDNYWPKNPSSCRFCDFKAICKTDPGQRINFLKTTFKRERREYVRARKS